MITYGQISDIGQVRKHNQDAVYSQLISGGGAYSRQDIGIFFVVDGMGAEISTPLSAEIVLETVVNHLHRFLILPIFHNYIPPIRQTIEEVLGRAFEEANKANLGKFQGASGTLAFIVDKQIHIAHVGDTAAFLLNKGAINRITEAHHRFLKRIEINEFFDGYKDTNNYSEVLYSAFGQSETLSKKDFHYNTFEAESGILLCSASLWKTLSEDEILAIVRATYHPQDACQRLVDAVNDKGGQDNTSVILVSNQFPFKL